jgi:hypothetical protein
MTIHDAIETEKRRIKRRILQEWPTTTTWGAPTTNAVPGTVEVTQLGQAKPERLPVGTAPLRRTITVGPFPIFFGNRNQAMGLKPHQHTAAVTLVYAHPHGVHGYPSFAHTNDDLRARLQELTTGWFEGTNEDVAAQLWDGLVEFDPESWHPYGGEFWLHALHLDVQGVPDAIGHDASTTRYTVQEG